MALGAVRTFPGLLEVTYKGLHEEGMPLLRQALAAAGDPGQRARVQLLIDNLDYAKLTADLYALSKTVTVGDPTMATARAARDLCVKRTQELAAKAHTNLHSSGHVRGVEQNFYLPFKPEVYERVLTEAAGGRSKVTVRRAAAAPVIDGDLADACWASAEEMAGSRAVDAVEDG